MPTRRLAVSLLYVSACCILAGSGIRAEGGGASATEQSAAWSILVVGSLNVDITMEVDRVPNKDETLAARSPFTSIAVGGKGANQAVAASRLTQGTGRAVQLITRFGNDQHATMLEDALRQEKVLLDGSNWSTTHPSGQGYVLLGHGGSATSVVVGGANSVWLGATAEHFQNKVAAAGVVMLQREVPEHVNLAVAQAADASGVPVMLDAGGEDRPIDPKLLSLVDVLCPNEGELERLSGMPVGSEKLILAAIDSLQVKGARGVLVTLGERGAILVTEDKEVFRQTAYAAPGGRVVDATGAGDAFRAAFAVALVEGRPLQECLQFAAAAGAIAVATAGAVPSLPTRMECDRLLETGPAQGATTGGTCRDGKQHAVFNFASRLNSMKARPDLWPGPLDLEDMIHRQSTVPGLHSVFFNYPQHLEGQSLDDIRTFLSDSGLEASAVCMRFPSSMGLGALTNPEPKVREEAIRLTGEACQWARNLGAPDLIIWPQTDGYDYPLQVDYTAAWERAVLAYREICDQCADLRVSLEFKPTDEMTRFSIVPSTGAALLLVHEVQRTNMGLTMDVGHLLMAGENPAQSVEMVGRAGKLFGMQFGDGHSRLGAEDGLMFGTVHHTQMLELLLWLQKVEYDAPIYFDTFPRNEDPVKEARYNIRKFKHMWELARVLRTLGLEDLLAQHDALAVLELVDTVDSIMYLS